MAVTSTRNRSSNVSYRESERILSVTSTASTAYELAPSAPDGVPLNPALTTSFPWLSAHAALYERYRVKNIVYRYTPLVGTNTSGQILLSFDYDTLDDGPTSAVNLTQASVYVTGAPWKILELRVPTDGKWLYTRTTEPSAGTSIDLKTYDMGRLWVATEGTADATLGYLEVLYDIELKDKQPNTLVPATNSVKIGEESASFSYYGTNISYVYGTTPTLIPKTGSPIVWNTSSISQDATNMFWNLEPDKLYLVQIGAITTAQAYINIEMDGVSQPSGSQFPPITTQSAGGSIIPKGIIFTGVSTLGLLLYGAGTSQTLQTFLFTLVQLN